MIKVRLFIFLLVLGFTLQTFGALPEKEPGKETDKVVLPYYELEDPAIKFAVFDVHNMILRKSKGFLWPAAKITLSKDGDKLIFVIMAIDNSWCNMFKADETPHGYLTINGRLFIVSTKGDIPAEFQKFFIPDPEIKDKTFYKADAKAKPVAKNPVWTYLYQGDKMATVLNSVYTENLGR